MPPARSAVCVLPAALLRHRGGALGRKALGRFGHEQDLDGQQQQLQIEHQRLLFDVLQIEAQLVVGAGVVLAVDLRVAGQAALHTQPVGKFRDLLRVGLHVLDALGPRADERHIALEDVEDLRQLVDAQLADDPPDARDARVARAARDHAAVSLGVDDHAAELDDLKHAPVFRAALLLEEHGAAVLELDRRRNGEKNRRGDDQREQRHHNVRNALEEVVPEALAVVLVLHQRRVDQVARAEALHRDLVELRRDIQAFAALHAVPEHLRAARAAPDLVEDDRVIRVELHFPVGPQRIVRNDLLHPKDVFELAQLPDELARIGGAGDDERFLRL